MRRLLVVAAVALLLSGCQESRAPEPSKTPVGPMTMQLKEEGDALAARGDYAGAVVKYRAAVNREPHNVSAWFALGSALSHIDRREETIQAFRRVVDLGRPDSQEVRTARQWLVKAGVLGESVSFTPSAPASESSAGTEPAKPAPKGKLRGRTEWQGLRDISLGQLKLTLSGDEAKTENRSFSRLVRLGEEYTFENVPPGTYRLVGEYGRGEQVWDQKVVIEGNKETVLDLTPANSPVPVDRLAGVRHPDRRPRPGGD